MRRAIIVLIRLVSSFFRSNNLRACRFHPSCSEYSVEAFQRLGLARAFFLSAKRVLRCHPFCEGGYDPLPEPNFLKIKG